MWLRLKTSSYCLAGSILLLLLASTCALGQTQQPAAKAQVADTSKTGSITGRVVNDSGQPLADATVWVYAVGSNTGPGQVVRTDRDGAFKLSDLERVPYMINVSMPAYTVTPREPDGTPQTRYHVGDSVTFVLIKGGVITGKVTTSAGDPVVGIGVRVEMIRDANGRRPAVGSAVRDGSTDDRGIYRIYGLPTGTYIVVAGGTHGYSYSAIDPYESNVPTYAPSATRDTAAEISVRAGDETTDVDIRYRGEPGRVISGTVSGPKHEDAGFNITLTTVSDAGPQTNKSTSQEPGGRDFLFNGIADGDYYLTAHTYFPGGEHAVSESKLIKVRGADVTGIELVARPLGLVSGRVVLEESKATECTDKRRPVFTEIAVSAWHKPQEGVKEGPSFIWSLGQPANADAQGNVSLRNLAPGQYRFATQFSAKDWYLQSISLAKPPATKSIDAARTWTTIKSGDRLSGLTITIAQGAASLHGQLALAEGETVPERLFVYLAPAERDKAEEVLRYYAGPVTSDGKFALNNLAPGRYWILAAQPAFEGAQSPLAKLRFPDEIETRSGLRREAEAAKNEIEFKPCQHLVDFKLPF